VQRTRNKNAMPPDLSCRVLRSGDSEVVLLSFTPAPRGKLTAAERDVALAVARGSSNAQIARDRQASPRTIANQVAAIMRKLGVSSRAELAARFGARDFV
jgi:DNA-binding NarL/FixJ family response regulator